MSVGRNEPCPCGSGKKHKHCCAGKKERTPQSMWTTVLVAFSLGLWGLDEALFRLRKTPA